MGLFRDRRDRRDLSLKVFETIARTRRVGGYEYELWLNASEYSRLSVFG